MTEIRTVFKLVGVVEEWEQAIDERGRKRDVRKIREHDRKVFDVSDGSPSWRLDDLCDSGPKPFTLDGSGGRVDVSSEDR